MKRISIILLLLLSLPAIWTLFVKPGFFPMHDDLQVMRVFEMENCLKDGQFPCRWAQYMAYGYGQPLFNFYSATPYYLGAFIRLIAPLSILFTVKVLFAFSLVASAFGMYMLTRKFFGERGALLSAILYLYAPYHSVDVYVRGAMSEVFALAILPYLWLAIYELIKKHSKFNFIFASAVFGLLLITHNLSTLMYAPFTIIWAIYWLLIERKNIFKNVLALSAMGLLGIGLAGFFIIPVAMEKNIIQTEFLTSDYLSYQNHFVSLHQLFISRYWDYGPSLWGDLDQMSFQIGWPHWVLAILSGLFALRSKNKLILLILALSGISVFLTHSKSLPIWESLSFMSIIQFPWRFLGIAIFLISFASASFVPKNKLSSSYFVGVIIILIIGLNFNYFRPKEYFEFETDSGKLSGENLVIQQKSAILDYLPKTAQKAPESLAGKPEVVEGDGITKSWSTRSNSFFFDLEVYREPVTVNIPVTYYPGWKVYLGNDEISIRPDSELGTIHFDVEKQGNYMVQGRFVDTPTRAAANWLTGISLLIIFIIILL